MIDYLIKNKSHVEIYEVFKTLFIIRKGIICQMSIKSKFKLNQSIMTVKIKQGKLNNSRPMDHRAHMSNLKLICT